MFCKYIDTCSGSFRDMLSLDFLINLMSFPKPNILSLFWFPIVRHSCRHHLMQDCIYVSWVIIRSAVFVFHSVVINRGAGRKFTNFYSFPTISLSLSFSDSNFIDLLFVGPRSASSLAMGAKLTSQKPPQLNSADIKADNIKYAPIPFGRLLNGKVSKLFVKTLER